MHIDQTHELLKLQKHLASLDQKIDGFANEATFLKVSVGAFGQHTVEIFPTEAPFIGLHTVVFNHLMRKRIELLKEIRSMGVEV